MVLEKTLESLLDSKEFKPVNCKVLNIHGRIELKLKPQNFDHLMLKAKSLEKNIMLGKIEGRKRRG